VTCPRTPPYPVILEATHSDVNAVLPSDLDCTRIKYIRPRLLLGASLEKITENPLLYLRSSVTSTPPFGVDLGVILSRRDALSWSWLRSSPPTYLGSNQRAAHEGWRGERDEERSKGSCRDI
jgi:hypothetical protein